MKLTLSCRPEAKLVTVVAQNYLAVSLLDEQNKMCDTLMNTVAHPWSLCTSSRTCVEVPVLLSGTLLVFRPKTVRVHGKDPSATHLQIKDRLISTQADGGTDSLRNGDRRSFYRGATKETGQEQANNRVCESAVRTSNKLARSPLKAGVYIT